MKIRHPCKTTTDRWANALTLHSEVGPVYSAQGVIAWRIGGANILYICP